MIRTIDSLSILNNFTEALKLTNANTTNKNKFFYYNKACLFAELNELDSAESCLNLFLKVKTYHYNIWYDNTLDNLKKSKKWVKIDSILNLEFDIENPDIKNPSLAKQFLKKGIIDQNYRGKLIRTENIFTSKSNIYEKIRKETDSIDILTALFIQNIIDSCGFWPGISHVGKKQNHYGVLLYQHTDTNFRNKNYAFMKEAFKKSEISNNEFAMITDRIFIGEGKQQIYGTQFRMGSNKKLILSGNVNIKKINKNRKQIGLLPLKNN